MKLLLVATTLLPAAASAATTTAVPEPTALAPIAMLGLAGYLASRLARRG